MTQTARSPTLLAKPNIERNARDRVLNLRKTLNVAAMQGYAKPLGQETKSKGRKLRGRETLSIEYITGCESKLATG